MEPRRKKDQKVQDKGNTINELHHVNQQQKKTMLDSYFESNPGGNQQINCATSASLTQLTSCTHCTVYFPLLKNFVAHLESSHADRATKDGTKKYTCNICHREFHSAVMLGKHTLEHMFEGEVTVEDAASKLTNDARKQNMISSQSEEDGMNETAANAPGSKRKRGRPPNRQGKTSQKKAPSGSTGVVTAGAVRGNRSQLSALPEEAARKNQGKGDSFTIVRPREEEAGGSGSKLVIKSPFGLSTTAQETTAQEDGDVGMKNVDDINVVAGMRKRRNSANQCVVCLEEFPTKDGLRKHRKVHGDKDTWPCSACDKEFTSHWKFYEHCVKAHKNKKPFQCDECGKCLSSFTILATHKGLHTGSRPYACNICGKAYLVAAGLKDHLIAHKNERSHRCEVCDAGFNVKGDLKKHMVTHMLDKPHCCSICNTGFNRTASLKRHMRSHTGEKPFHCDLCDKSFSRNEKLKEHRRTHTGERPLKCPHCPMSFKDSSNFSNHKKIHAADYIPRKRKRRTIMADHSRLYAADGEDIPTSPATTSEQVESVVAEAEAAANIAAELGVNKGGGESGPVDARELSRQLLGGAAMDPSELQNLGAIQNVAGAVSGLEGGVFNLSPVDLRSLQIIISGLQARNQLVINTTGSRSEGIGDFAQNPTSSGNQ